MRLWALVLLVLAGCGSETVAPVDISGVPMSLKTDYTITTTVRDYAVDGNYLYILGGDDGGLYVYDISTPTAPALLGSSAETMNARAVAVSGNLVAVTGSAYGVLTFDVSDKANPAFLGMEMGGDVDGEAAVIVGSTVYAVGGGKLWSFSIVDPAVPVALDYIDVQGLPQDIAVSGNYAYLACASGSGEGAACVVVDVSDPSDLSIAGTLTIASPCYGIALDGNYAYLAASTGGLAVVDVSTPASPTLYASLDTSGDLYGIDISGDYAFAAGYEAGLILIDIEDPATPVEREVLELSGSAFEVTVSGGYAYASTQAAIIIAALSDVTAHTITATAGAHGVITPSGPVSVEYGEDQAFTIAAHQGWQIVAVTVDGDPVGVLSTYTFEDVTEDHTITATFGKQVIYEAESALSKTVTAESALTRTVTANSALCRTVSAKSALTRSLYFESALCRTVSAKSRFVGSR